MISLDGQKPTICLTRVQRMLAECNLTLDDNVLKQRLMQAIPISVKTLCSLDFPGKNFAKISLTDTIYSCSNTVIATCPPNVFAASKQQMPTGPFYNQQKTTKQPTSKPIEIKNREHT